MTGTLVYAATFWDLDCVGLRDDETHSTARPNTGQSQQVLAVGDHRP
jgi:hypothetical protein